MLKPASAACTAFVLASLISLTAPAARGADHFLTIGGGYSPTGNQISLEKNAILFQKLLAERYSAGVPHDLYFSDGRNPQRDLQFDDPNAKIPKANLLVARVFRQTRYQSLNYRSHHVPDVKGESNRANLEKWFKTVGGKLQKCDRLFVYVTAHGGSVRDKKNKYNTALYHWNTHRLPMTDFAAMLDEVSDEVPVCMVMVQCYTGGFANILFEKGDATKGLSKGNRCGFFATVHTRPAAGCTPDINEANYQEYSTSFWEAIRGRKRNDDPVSRPDFNGDGATSFDEAHAYTLLNSDTIDVSLKTSDRFLRVYSRTSHAKSGKKAGGRKRPVEAVKPVPELLTPDARFAELLELASPSERAVLVGLSEQLKLKSPKRSAEAAKLAAKILKQKRALDADKRKKVAEYGKIAGEIQKVVVNRWPEFSNRWHPAVDGILKREGDAIVKLIESHPKYGKLDALRKEVDELSTKSLNLDRRWAKTQRVIRTLENVALAANLPKVARPEIVDRFAKLRELEAVTLPPVLSGETRTDDRATR